MPLDWTFAIPGRSSSLKPCLAWPSLSFPSSRGPAMMCPSHPRARNVHLDRTACETLLPVQWSPAGATIQARETSRAEHRPVITLTRQRVELGIQVFHSGCDWNVRSPVLSST